MDAAAIIALINEILALLPVLVSAGANIANLVSKIEDVWAQTNIQANDPQFAAVTAQIEAARATLKSHVPG